MYMNAGTSPVEAQYTRNGLFEAIMDALAKTGVNATNITRTAIAGADEFHVRGKEVSLELAMAAGIQRGSKVLDVGCGIGGPCRMLAAEYGCTVTGIDITHEYIRTATMLSKLVQLDHLTHFVQGSALDLPFPAHQFDVVWTQHVQMNIADKQTFYAAIKSALSPTGRFIYYDIFSTGDDALQYPLPWANTPALSHLITTHQLKTLLQQNGLHPISTTDQTEKGIQFFAALLQKIEEQRLPAVSLQLVMGEQFAEKIRNLYNGLVAAKVVLQSGICVPL
jgi:ubiquinone/menaquinone biosynthesis C-methylase UbiE